MSYKDPKEQKMYKKMWRKRKRKEINQYDREWRAKRKVELLKTKK